MRSRRRSSKWVFKKKRNGIYRAMLVRLGYSRLPEVDHKDNFLPVVLDTTFRYKLVLALINDWDMEVVDIDIAFIDIYEDTRCRM